MIPRTHVSDSSESFASTASTAESAGPHPRHFPPLKLQRNRESTSTIASNQPDTRSTTPRVSSSPYLFPLPPVSPSRLPVLKKPHTVPKEQLRSRKADDRVRAYSGGDPENRKPSKRDHHNLSVPREPRDSWSDWIGTRSVDTRDLQALPSTYPPGMLRHPSSSRRGSLNGILPERNSTGTDIPLNKTSLHMRHAPVQETGYSGHFRTGSYGASLPHRKRRSLEGYRAERPRSYSLSNLSSHAVQSYRLSSESDEAHNHATRLPIPYHAVSDPQTLWSVSRLSRSATSSPSPYAVPLDLSPSHNVALVQKHRSSYSMNSTMDSKSHPDQTMDAIQESPNQLSSAVFPNFGESSTTGSSNSGRRRSTDRLSVTPLSFSHLRAYDSDPDPKRRNSISGASRDHFDLGGDAQFDGHETSGHVARSKSVNSVGYNAVTFRKLHGGISPNIDVEELEAIRTSTHARPPITSRTSPQYSRAGFQTPSIRSVEADLPASLTRRASYSSVTGISPVADGRFSFESATYPRTRRSTSSRIETTQLGLDGSDGTRPGSLPDSPTSFSPVHGAYHIPLSVVQLERRRVDDFDFATTFDVVTRPYTPDQFAVDAGMVNKSATTTRNPSKRSARSFGSIGGRSFGSMGAKLSKSSTGGTTRSAATGRNVLTKVNRKLKHENSWDGAKEVLTSEYQSQSAPPNNGSIFQSLQSRSTRSQSFEHDFVEMPHTATTSSGPARAVITQAPQTSPAALSVSSLPIEKQASTGRLAKLGSIARDGKGKYRAMANDVKQKIGSRKNSRHKKRSFNSSDNSQAVPPTDYESRPEGEPVLSHSAPAAMQLAQLAPAVTTFTRTSDRANRTPPAILVDSYYENQQNFKNAWNRGMGDALDEWNERRALERTYRYGPAGRKIKMYMSGALPDSPSTIENLGKKMGLGSKLSDWEKSGAQWIKRSRSNSKRSNNGASSNGEDLALALESDVIVTDGEVSEEQRFAQSVHDGIVEFLQSSKPNPEGGIKEVHAASQSAERHNDAKHKSNHGKPTASAPKPNLTPVQEGSSSDVTHSGGGNTGERKGINGFVSWVWAAAKGLFTTKTTKPVL